MNNGNFSPSLFDEQKGMSEIQIREDERRRLLEDPNFVIQAYQQRLASVETQLTIYKPKAELYDTFLSSIGEVDCSAISNIITLYYVNPKGKISKVGSDYILQILEYDNILRKEFNGYELYATHKEYGRTKYTTRYGYNYSSVIFNAKGVDYLVRKYKDDKRVWRAINRKLVCESEIN